MQSAHPKRRRSAPKRHAEPLQHADMPPHGKQIGRILIEYRGQVVEAKILQAGDRCRTHGVSIDGGPVELLGLYRAAALATAKVARLPSIRSTLWRDMPHSESDELDAMNAC